MSIDYVTSVPSNRCNLDWSVLEVTATFSPVPLIWGRYFYSDPCLTMWLCSMLDEYYCLFPRLLNGTIVSFILIDPKVSYCPDACDPSVPDPISLAATFWTSYLTDCDP